MFKNTSGKIKLSLLIVLITEATKGGLNFFNFQGWNQKMLSSIFGGAWWCWAIVCLVGAVIAWWFEKNSFITLEEAGIILYRKWKPEAWSILDVSPFESTLTNETFENIQENKTQEYKDFNIPQIINYLLPFFREGVIRLYGVQYPNNKKEIIPLSYIKNVSYDFKDLFYDDQKTYKSYESLCCKRGELINFLKMRKQLPINKQLILTGVMR